MRGGHSKPNGSLFAVGVRDFDKLGIFSPCETKGVEVIILLVSNLLMSFYSRIMDRDGRNDCIFECLIVFILEIIYRDITMGLLHSKSGLLNNL